MKKAIKQNIYRLFKKLKWIYEEYKLHVIFKNPNVHVGEGVTIEEYFSADLPTGDFSIELAPYVYFKKYCHIMVLAKAKLSIGANVFFNNYCSINCLDKISIGENTQFGEGVKLYDHNHTFGYDNGVFSVARDKFTTSPIIIGKNCWIGSNVTILKGVTIGDNVIIGANSLIYKSVPANTVLKVKADYILEKHPLKFD